MHLLSSDVTSQRSKVQRSEWMRRLRQRAGRGGRSDYIKNTAQEEKVSQKKVSSFLLCLFFPCVFFMSFDQ